MKRVLAFASALALVVGAFAPATFASDLPSVPVPEDNLSIWDSGSTDIENPYDVDDLFNYCQNFWGDLFDDGRFNNHTVSDYQRDIVGLAVSKFVSTHSDEEVNGVMTSYFDDIVDYVCSNPSDFDIFWTPDGIVSALTGNPYLNLKFGDDFYDNLYDFVIANYYTTPSSSTVTIGSGAWVQLPFSIGSYSFSYFYSADGGSTAGWTAYATNVNGNGLICVDIGDNTNYGTTHYSVRGDGGSSQRLSGGSATGSVHKGRYSPLVNYGVPSGISTSQYSSLSAAVNDFYNNSIVVNSGNPVSNGKVYIREEPVGGDSLTVSFPALPVSNSKAVSNYYYDTYGDTWEDNSSVINNTVYNNSTTTVYPVTYDNNIPLWLVTPSTSITSYNYSLDLPSADLEELPTEFEGGGDFFQDSFLALGGFGSFVLIAFSFGLVALFFKG